jgi:tetratricopeptide (TPR) repeat protein
MTSQSYPWISRQAANAIYQKILTKPSGVYIYLVNAPAGVGKTYLARDIGTRLGSKTGYEPGHDGDIYWSGIVDLYDPDMNNGRHIEVSWKIAFSSPPHVEFRDYDTQRISYVEKSRQGTLGSEMDNQLQAVRKSFAAGMEKISRSRYPVMAFDTVERLRTVLDPTQERIDIQDIAAPDVFEWLFFQIENLSRGIVLMMGRSAPGMEDSLNTKIEMINLQRRARGLQPVYFETVPLDYLSLDEMKDFYRHRVMRYPRLKNLLTDDIEGLLSLRSQGNPLLLDIALQTLLETNSFPKVRDALQSVQEEEKQMEPVEDALLWAYMNSGSAEKQFLLTYLSIARNGLFEKLLEHLVGPDRFLILRDELEKMGELPFVKVRDIAQSIPGQEERTARKTFFLHDAMYAICDRVRLVPGPQLQEGSSKIVEWYDSQIQQHSMASVSEREYLHNDVITDLLVESVPYRMRSNPQQGYEWYLDQSDQAIRGVARGRDARLRDAMAQFFGSAAEKGKTGTLPANIMDDVILRDSKSAVFERFKLDSALQWIKRYSMWGKHARALEVAKQATWIRQGYLAYPDRYFLTYTESLLWTSQSYMYSGESESALKISEEILDILQTKYPLEKVEQDILVTPRKISGVCFIIGRCHNNRGYIFWYKGKYWLAIEEFTEALKYYAPVSSAEEIANAKDNMGRVYILLGYSDQAFDAIREGLKSRIAAGSSYREALSRNSLAIALARFNSGQQALREVNLAQEIFRRHRIERGIALSHFTRGVATRRNEGELWEDMELTVDEALKAVSDAETDLQDALAIFSESVQEPIRKVQIYNELACNYRTRYQLLLNKKDAEGQKRVLDQGINYFEIAIDEAIRYKFDIERLDSLQDRAVLYINAGQFSKAREDMQTIRDMIPATHKIEPHSGLSNLEITERVDSYYKLMGQLEWSIGEIICEEGGLSSETKKNISENTLLKAMEHYMLAVAYFNAFSGATFTNRRINYPIYTRLRESTVDFLMDLRDVHLPNWLNRYNLHPDLIRTPFDEIFGLLIPGDRRRNWGQSFRH